MNEKKIFCFFMNFYKNKKKMCCGKNQSTSNASITTSDWISAAVGSFIAYRNVFSSASSVEFKGIMLVLWTYLTFKYKVGITNPEFVIGCVWLTVLVGYMQLKGGTF